jgi:hypothetical protein
MRAPPKMSMHSPNRTSCSAGSPNSGANEVKEEKRVGLTCSLAVAVACPILHPDRQTHVRASFNALFLRIFVLSNLDPSMRLDCQLWHLKLYQSPRLLTVILDKAHRQDF